MSAIDPLPDASVDAAVDARVSTKGAWWSVGLALIAVGVLVVAGWGAFIALGYIFGSILAPGFQATFRVIGIMIYAVVIGILLAAVLLGVRSIVRAWTQRGRPRRTRAIVVGCIGIALSVLIAWVLVLPVFRDLLAQSVS